MVFKQQRHSYGVRVEAVFLGFWSTLHAVGTHHHWNGLDKSSGAMASGSGNQLQLQFKFYQYLHDSGWLSGASATHHNSQTLMYMIDLHIDQPGDELHVVLEYTA